MYGMSKHLKNRYKSNHKRKGGVMGDTYTGECKICGVETDLIMGVCQDCSLNEEWDTSKGFVCEQHPDKEFPHDDCSGPGIPDYKGILRARGEK